MRVCIVIVEIVVVDLWPLKVETSRWIKKINDLVTTLLTW